MLRLNSECGTLMCPPTPEHDDTNPCNHYEPPGSDTDLPEATLAFKLSFGRGG